MPTDTAPSAHLMSLPWPLRRDDEECLHLALATAGPVPLTLAGRRLDVEPGDLVLVAGALPPGPLRDGGRFTVFRVPGSYLGVPAADLRALTHRQVGGGSGLGAPVSQLLTALARGTGGRRLALNAAELVVLLVQDLLRERHRTVPDVTGAMLDRIRDHIGEHLGDPGMSPETIARAHHISVRYLHKLFHGEGTTVGTWIRRRRLEVCRLELGGASGRRRTVAAVAQSWGFTSASHFSRLFKEAYGMSPRSWRDLAAADG
ncbi:helix-turn-helix domain-containing protein [Streptomyces sp. CRN 30]|uniref:helix-turn-helix domain-containing protein n=1 Tax=Streptomyces sp. CRN 30 TaxID=3075613 RepID=UPI002A8155CA|nr:helix-turn-helix domain-containing protein [Streptomyces sp. CRN 30]